MTTIAHERTAFTHASQTPSGARAVADSVHEQIAAVARRTPDATAVRCGGEVLSYAQLDARAGAIAAALVAEGVAPGARVGLCTARSLEVAVGVLGILKAGCAWVPLDPMYPRERLAFMLADAGLTALVGQRQVAAALPAHGATMVWMEDVAADASTAVELPPVRAEAVAYVIYTSGSTGMPKGVMITHGSLAHYVAALREPLGIATDDRYLHTASIAFSSSVRQLLVPLTAGATVVVATPEQIRDPRELFRLVQREGVTVLDLVPSYQQNCIRVLETIDESARARLLESPLRQILSASEPLPSDVPERWRALLGAGVRLTNMFGQTETTGIVAINPIGEAPSRDGLIVPIGRPIAGLRFHVLDERLAPVPDGEAGELCVAGASVGLGYLNRADLTAERFVADPFADDPASRMYRSGDRVRRRADGTVEFLGRGDNQVKVRGFRVEIEEVEAALRRQRGVRECAVVAWPDATGELRLVAYVVSNGRPAPAPGALRRALAGALPEYMVPATWVALDALPRTPNGKVSRGALPAPEGATTLRDREHVPASTPTERMLAEIWSEVLGIGEVGTTDDFFALGGHSLKAAQVVARIRQALRIELPLIRLFEAPTVAALAASIDAERAAPAAERPALERLSAGVQPPLSFAQERLWLLNQIEPDGAAYNLCAAMRLRGALDEPALARTLAEVVRRHAALRTVFRVVDGAPVQQVLDTLEVPVRRMTLAAATQPVLDAAVADEARRTFDLANGPLVRAALFRVSDAEHVLVVSMHHIVSDGWSRGVLYQEIATLYDAFARGEPSPLPELAVQYADYAAWQRRWLREDVLERQLGFWREQLAGPLPTLDLPTDRPRPALQTSNGAVHSFVLPQSLCDELQALARQEGATFYMVLLAAFQTLLGRYAGQEDVIVGSPVAGRATPEVEDLIGFFVNTLVMRGDLSGAPSFRELVGRTRGKALAALAHQDLPFDRLVDALHPTRDLSRSPIFQVLFILQNTPLRRLELTGLEVEHMNVDVGAAKLDVTLSLVAAEQGYVGHLEYNTDLFDGATIERLAGHFRMLLESAAAQPDTAITELALLTPPERRQLLVDWNGTDAPYPQDTCVHELFEAQARRTPDATAASFEGSSLSYAELDTRANQLAHHLRAMGVGPGTLVGVCVERSLEMLVGMMGILKAGGAYVPLDPAYPRDRIALMLEDSKAPVVLTLRRHRRRVPATGARVLCLDSDWATIAKERTTAPDARTTSDDLAYVIYTSGSTGRPKGVMVMHRNVVNFFTGMDERVGQEEPGTWLAVTSISFDISVLELLWTLSRGYHVVIQGDERASARRAGATAASSRTIEFSLFYFASEDRAGDGDKYRLLFEGAKFADRNGFAAVWTPERHFHAFGGLYPNAATTSAALAAMTQNVKLRAGSVVLPLHNPVRVAEEWAFVDNISNGRVGIAVASGWHDRDFVFAPENYANRRDVMYEQVETVRRLWRGEKVTMRGGTGKDVEISTLPRPVQAELPIWVTAAGTRETFEKAGQIGANLLTHLLGQSPEQLAEKLAAYRRAWRESGREGEGHVTLMMHTFVGEDLAQVRAAVWKPFRDYLRTSVDLIKGLAEGRGQDIRAAGFTAEDMEALLDHAFERYFQTSALMGTPESCLEMVEKLKGMGVDEVACLIDFGVDRELTLSSLDLLAELKDEANRTPTADAESYGIGRQLARHQVTHLQCTPSMASMLLADDEARKGLRGVRTLMIGGEAFPGALAADLQSAVGGRIVNMYGPTETTIWSSTQRVDATPATIPLGRPIANTEFYLLDRHMQPVPVGVPGELCIGGAGVVRGYFDRPDLTAERFIAHPFGGAGRLYRTGDLARYRADGTVEFLGRLDHQVKVRGHRIELGEIESQLIAQPGVREAVVVAREDGAGDKRLVGYVSLTAEGATTPDALREALRVRLPEYMVPAHVVVLDALPLTPNAKIDRKALPAPEAIAPAPAVRTAPASEVEETIAAIWRDVLRAPEVGVQDNFFDVGGHSLLVVRVHARLRAAIDVPVTITDLFRFPTIRALAQHLGSGNMPAPRQGDAAADRAEARRAAMQRRRNRPQ